MQNEPTKLEQRIKSHYESLPQSERRLADVILDFPGEVASYQAAELAAKAGVSKAAATRLFKRLGYDSYNAVRIEARKIRSAGSPVHLNRIAAPESDLGRAIAAHLENDIENVVQTFARVNHGNLHRILGTIRQAQRIYVVGHRNSYTVGSYLHSELSRIRSNVFMLPRTGQTLAEDLVDLSPKDLVVVVGLRRRVLVSYRIIDLARSVGARVLFFTDTKHHGSFPESTWVIRAQIQGVSLFDSYVGLLSLLNFICTRVAQQMKATGRSRLKQIDEILSRLDELDERP